MIDISRNLYTYGMAGGVSRPFQDIETMVGYCMKDAACAHYRFFSTNLSPESLARCAGMYQVVRSSHMDGRKSVSKRTTIRFLWQEWNVHVRSVHAMRARE